MQQHFGSIKNASLLARVSFWNMAQSPTALIFYAMLVSNDEIYHWPVTIGSGRK
jgi:hypothetical protein